MFEMAELDRVREKIAYLKYWQGFMVVTAISVFGWLMTAADAAPVHIFVLAWAGVIALTLGILALHRQIDRFIDDVGRL